MPPSCRAQVSGTLRVQLKDKRRPQSLILGHCQEGEMLGESTYLLDAQPAVSILCDSSEAVVVWLPKAKLERLFINKLALAARFWCVVAMRASARLEMLKQQDGSNVKVKIDNGADVPRTMAAVSANPAFFLIFQKYVLTTNSKEELGPALDFIHKVHSIASEPDVKLAWDMVKEVDTEYLKTNAPRPLCVQAVLDS